MAYSIPPAKIAEWKQFLKDHPIDPAWDDAADIFDAYVPQDERMARSLYHYLKMIGEIE